MHLGAIVRVLGPGRDQHTVCLASFDPIVTGTQLQPQGRSWYESQFQVALIRRRPPGVSGMCWRKKRSGKKDRESEQAPHTLLLMLFSTLGEGKGSRNSAVKSDRFIAAGANNSLIRIAVIANALY